MDENEVTEDAVMDAIYTIMAIQNEYPGEGEGFWAYYPLVPSLQHRSDVLAPWMRGRVCLRKGSQIDSCDLKQVLELTSRVTSAYLEALRSPV
jgi:hypothetical protein